VGDKFKGAMASVMKIFSSSPKKKRKGKDKLGSGDEAGAGSGASGDDASSVGSAKRRQSVASDVSGGDGAASDSARQSTPGADGAGDR
jgi:hypothetical protein